MHPGDSLWVRLVELPAALQQRTYAAPCDVVLEVADESCPWNARSLADRGVRLRRR